MDAMKLLGGLLGNKSLSSGLGSKVLGSLLGGGGQQQSAGGGIGNLIGGLLGGGGGGGDLVGGLLKSVMGGGSAPEAAPAATQPAPQVDQQQAAVLMIRAMVNAAKSDGRIDQSEQDNIVSKLGDLDQAEIDFLRSEFAAPLDVAGFARSIPSGLEQQVYAVSLTSIDLDSQNEAQYLGQLAQGMNMNPELCNQIHDHFGAPKIFG